MKSKPKLMTQPEDWLTAWDKQVQRDGYTSLSEWIGDCCNVNLDKDLLEGLSKRKGAHRPKVKKDG